MPRLPRGTCPVCRADVALRNGDVIREHKDHRHELYGTGRDAEVPTCSGSGRDAEPYELATIAVYVPNPDADTRLRRRLWLFEDGTAIVGSPATPWFERRGGDSATLDARGLIIDHHAPDASTNVRTFCDRVMVAALRHRDHAPTHKRMMLDQPDALMHVANYDFASRQTDLIAEGGALVALARWVGACGDDPATLDSRKLHAELRRSR